MTDHFSARAPAYARARPSYPDDLVEWLVREAPARGRAWDAGCGSGQMSALLGERFDAVVATDFSAAQIAHARRHGRVHYVVARAEAAPLADACCDLVVAAQAAHWFDLARFHAEARRVVRKGGLVGLVSYGLPRIAPDVDALVARFHHTDVGAFWPPQRRMVDDGYATIDFPFDELRAPAFAIRRRMRAADFVDYVDTWSAVQRARAAGQGARFDAFAARLREAWGALERSVEWPLSVRAGRP